MSAILKMLQNRAVQVELKSEKVELGLVDDYNTRVDKAFDSVKGALVAQSKLAGKLSGAVIQMELAMKEAAKIDKAAKELGVKSPIKTDKTEGQLKQLQKALATVKGLSL